MGVRDIKAAINAVPAKPIIATALTVTLLAAGWHGYTLHRICTSRADLSASLKQWTEGVLQARVATPLTQAVGSDWDEVRIATAAQAPANAISCPFGWHWSNEERAAVAKDGHLTMFGFFKDARLLEVADFDSRWARFDVSDDAIPRDKAVFEASSTGNALQLTRPGN